MGNSVERIHWVDWAKAIGIWLVIMGHSPAEGHIFIYMFHMPFFFILSGYLHKKVGVIKELVKSFYGLIIPYFLYNAILLLVSVISGEYQKEIILNVLLGNQEGIDIKYFSPLWFLVSLFTMRLVISFIEDKYLKVVLLISIVLSILLYKCDFFEYNTDYYQLCTSIVCFPFYIVGNMLRTNSIFMKDNSLCSPMFILMAMLFLLFIGYNNGPVNIFRAAQVGNSILVFYLVGFGLSILIILLMSKYLNIHSSIIETLSKGTLLILCIHQLMIVTIDEIYPLNTISSLFLSFVISIISYVLIKISMRFCPMFIGK